jgi:hypothetical protein
MAGTTRDSADGKPERPRFARVVARAASGPINLTVAGAGIAGALALNLWPLAALGGAAYLALVGWDLASPDFWKKTFARPEAGDTIAGDEEDTIPDPASLRDPIARDAATGVLAARKELDRVVGEASTEVGVELAGLLVNLDELQGRAAGLIRRAEDLALFLGKSDPEPVRREIARLTDLSARTTDIEARAQYDSALASRQEQLRVLDDIASALERLRANLTRIVATFEGLSAKVVRMGAMDAQAMDHLSGDMNQELERMNGEIHTFEETLRHLVTVEVPGA